MLIEVLWPVEAKIKVDTLEIVANKLILSAHGTQTVATCPQCQGESKRIHSYYHRYPADLPCVGFGVQLNLTVPRFFCDNNACTRRTFAATFSGMLNPYARRTTRLRSQQQQVGFAINSEVGADLLDALGMKTSPDTIIRLVRQVPEPEFDAPRVLGIDDWALRKGQTYGTILVDLEKHQVIDLLPDRSAESVSQWLEAHPGVEIVTRDRGAAYIEGVTSGAPEAVQIADRFHLLQNVVDALKRIVAKQTKNLRTVAHQMATEMPDQQTDKAQTAAALESPGSLREEEPSWRELCFAEVKVLQAKGWSRRAVAKRLNLDRRTVSNYFDTDSCPQRPPVPQSTSTVAPYLSYLSQRWQEGCQNIKQLHAELEAQGFEGHYASVRRAVKRLLGQGWLTEATACSPVPIPRLSVSEATWILAHQDDRLDDTQRQLREKLCQVSDKINTAHQLTQSFCKILRERLPDGLDGWLLTAEQSGLAPFKNFAAGLRRDYDAVRAALTYEWSQGQVEGQVNRLKLIKRSMYGRANFDLLRKRVLGLPVPT